MSFRNRISGDMNGSPMITSALSTDQRDQASALVEPAVDFLAAWNHPLGEAIVRHLWLDGPAEAVITALAEYQNTDGGFGQGLEVDIEGPASNPFAARLAMQAMLVVPLDASEEMRDRLKSWLVANQNTDGDWHFSPEVRKGSLAPWFAAWEFPALNPACCVAAYARKLDIATPGMLQRVSKLFASKASLDEARSGDFYSMLPYVEYATAQDIPGRDQFIEAIAEGIRNADSAGTYDDAGHFFDHALAAGPDVIALLPEEMMTRHIDQLLAEPQDDGGWPSPYNPAWRPWTTAMSMVTLARLRDGL